MAPKRLNVNRRKPWYRSVLRTVGQLTVVCVIQLAKLFVGRKINRDR